MNYREQYQAWLTMFRDDAATYRELENLTDEKEIEDRFYRDLEFGTAGMRGVIGAGTNRMNFYTVRRVTLALAHFLKTFPEGAERGVAIGYDSRRFSTEFAREAALVLANEGVKAFLFDALRPVALLSFAVRSLHCLAGIVITASHNPPEYNGYKVYWEDGGQLPPDRAKEITCLLPDIAFDQAKPMEENEAREKGLLKTIGKEIDDAYIARVKTLQVNPALAQEMGKTLKIVYTPLNGSGNVPVRRILREIGMENVYVVPEQELPNGDFPTVRVPNPEEKDAFRLAVELQKKLGADLCVGTDPDCDRVGVACLTADGEVRLLNGNQIGVVLLHYILSQKQKLGTLPQNAAAVKSFVSSEMARAICEHYGVKLFDVLTGFKFIAEKIHEFEVDHSYAFQFGFEESYGYLSGTDVRDKDGVNACMLIAEAACFYKQKGLTLVDAVEELYREYGYFEEKTISVTLSGKDGMEKIQNLMTALRKNPPSVIGGQGVLEVRDYMARPEKSNAIYFRMENGWACVRPSGTEPKLKLYAGAKGNSHAQAGEMLRGIEASLRETLGL
ncbi:MAG TPA: phospho-sugar mutase [Candidatus Pullichristensenella excrementigallinarum]|uniref:Phosphoglucomutase n=1 Tax=Candidatus Pullichristensenella excrementigallinarum TaxID=2840907 RepID=A0A9D1ICY4_9FIRM|nr:phospho-sugar mutase [Candidatus Pullichristensenella excrementigallinarum]